MFTPIAEDVNEGIQAAKKIRLPKWALLCIGLVAFLLYFVFYYFGRLDLDLPILNFIAVICFILFVKRKLRRYAWFWITMVAIVAAHVPLFMFVPWTTRWIPALMIAVIDSADFCLMLWVISAVGNFMKGSEAAEG
jgi:hypothetical protein